MSRHTFSRHQCKTLPGHDDGGLLHLRHRRRRHLHQDRRIHQACRERGWSRPVHISQRLAIIHYSHIRTLTVLNRVATLEIVSYSHLQTRMRNRGVSSLSRPPSWLTTSRLANTARASFRLTPTSGQLIVDCLTTKCPRPGRVALRGGRLLVVITHTCLNRLCDVGIVWIDIAQIVQLVVRVE